MKTATCALLLCLLSASAAETTRPVEAYSRIHHHKDGTRTESRKHGNGNEIHELTYNKDNVLKYKRIFLTDNKGRSRRGYILDGKENPLGSIEFGYDSTTDQLVEERQFNKEGKLIRRLFYPGALKDPRYAKRFVAFNYDPADPRAKPVQETRREVRPTKPVESDQDEFEPGIPIGRGAATPGTAAPPPAAMPAPATPAPKTPGRFFRTKPKN